MKTKFILTSLFFISLSSLVKAQDHESSGTFWEPVPANYKVKHAIEIESLFPMFFYGGYHVGVGYRYEKFRVRASIINGGSYNAETAGISNNADKYDRYYETGYGLFFGYNVWKNLEIYSYIERHQFNVEQKSSHESQIIKSIDMGIASSYQFFVGRAFYIQPGIHFYFRPSKSVEFTDNSKYAIPNVDFTIVIRAGLRLWKQFE